MKKQYTYDEMTIRNPEIAFHRNGICGEGFNVVRFDWKDDEGKPRKMLATVFHVSHKQPILTAVLALDDPMEAWRGDHFHDALVEAIVDDRKERWGPSVSSYYDEEIQIVQRT